MYVKYDTMIFYLLFLNATAFCLLIVAYNIILQFVGQNYVMKKALLIVDWGNKFEKINRRILNSLFFDNVDSRMYSVQYKGNKKIVEMKNISENISNQTKIMKIELNDDYDKNGQYLRGICGEVLEIRESEILVQYSKNNEITFTIKGVRLNLVVFVMMIVFF